ncbi:MAG: aspartate/glutamate racemase family protein [Myxococcales bacterium]|nr:aspartate/glutamate racemase family protein [Myxococcales bacterium]
MSGQLGILDWGIGGLDLYRRLRTTGARRNVIYWSDTGAPPYGTLTAEQLTRRMVAVIERLAAEGCGQLLVACNAASTVIDAPAVRQRAAALGMNVAGVIVPAVEAVRRKGLRSIAVIGGRRTIESRAYADPLEAAGCAVVQQVAQPLSALIEQGLTEGSEVDEVLREIVRPLRGQPNLLLGCTHYVAALPSIKRHLPGLRTVIDPVAETVPWVQRHFSWSGGDSRERMVTTGSGTAMRNAASWALGMRIPEVEEIELPFDDD